MAVLKKVAVKIVTVIAAISPEIVLYPTIWINQIQKDLITMLTIVMTTVTL